MVTLILDEMCIFCVIDHYTAYFKTVPPLAEGATMVVYPVVVFPANKEHLLKVTICRAFGECKH